MKNTSERKILHIDRVNPMPLWNFKQEDDGVLLLEIYKGGQALDVTGQAITLGVKNSKGQLIEHNTGVVINKSSVDITLSNSIFAVKGKLECDLILKDSQGQMSTAAFYLLVGQKVLGEENILSTNIIPTIDKIATDLETRGNKLIDDVTKDYCTLQKVIIDENAAADLQNQINGVNSSLDNITNQFDFWEVPNQPNTWANSNMNVNEFYSIFYDKYIGSKNDGYTVKRILRGKDEGNSGRVYQYIFSPKNPKRTIFLTSGMHGNEIIACFGLARLFYYIMEEPNVSDFITYLRENVKIIVIPIQNPYGFNLKQYGALNNISMNVDFDSNNRWATDVPSDNDWFKQGEKPFSLSETRIVRDVLNENKGEIEFWVDCHTAEGHGPYDSYFYANSSDKYLLPRFKKGVGWLDERTRKLLGREPVNSINLDSPTAIHRWYSFEQLGIPQITCELVPGRYGGSFNGEYDLKYYLLHLSTYLISVLSDSTIGGVKIITNDVVKNDLIKSVTVSKTLFDNLTYKDKYTTYNVITDGVYVGKTNILGGGVANGTETTLSPIGEVFDFRFNTIGCTAYSNLGNELALSGFGDEYNWFNGKSVLCANDKNNIIIPNVNLQGDYTIEICLDLTDDISEQIIWATTSDNNLEQLYVKNKGLFFKKASSEISFIFSIIRNKSNILLSKFGSEYKLYVNNVLINTLSNSTKADNGLIVGNVWQGTKGFTGKIHSIKINTKSLSDEERNINYCYEMSIER